MVLSSARGGVSAVLECVVENPEIDLKVWVNWTSGSGFDPLMRDDYAVGRSEGGVHFLVLHRVSEDKVNPHTCQLYSNYSPSVPEDQKIVNITVVGMYKYLLNFYFIYCSIIYADLQKCAETSGISKTGTVYNSHA